MPPQTVQAKTPLQIADDNVINQQVSQKNALADSHNALGSNPNAALSAAQIAGPAPQNTAKLDAGLQTIANQNPEQADKIMDSLGYTKMANAGTPAQPQVLGASTTNPTLASKYQQTFQNLNSSNAPAPTTAGQANALVQQATPPPPPPPPDTTKIDNLFTQNPGINQVLQQFQQYFSPPAQQQSLVDEYKQLTQSSGLQDINTQLINAKNVINGSEQDIRNEITKAGGFATESQVQALTAARNKTLIANYNTLLDQKNAIQDQVNTLIGLDEKDRAAAADRLDKQTNLSMQIYQMQQKMQDNARESLQHYADKMGYDTLYQQTQGDPYYINLAEQTLGLPSGSLASAAQQAQLDRQNQQQADLLTQQTKLSELETDKLQRESLKANIANTYSEIANRNATAANANGQVLGASTGPDTQSILSQTGLSLPAFNFITQGTAALTRMSAQQRMQIMNEAQSFLNNKGLDVSTFQSQYKAYNDVLQKNIERSNNTQIFGGEVAGTVDQFINDAGADFGKIKQKNLAKLWAGKQVNDPTTQKYAFNLQTLRNDLAGYYAASRGATSPSDADMRDAADVIQKGLGGGSALALKQAIQDNESKVTGVVNRNVDIANKKVWDLFGVGDRYKNKNSPQTSSTSVNMTSKGKGFDVTAAKAAGYTDKEIQDYIKSH